MICSIPLTIRLLAHVLCFPGTLAKLFYLTPSHVKRKRVELGLLLTDLWVQLGIVKTGDDLLDRLNGSVPARSLSVAVSDAKVKSS